MLLLSVIACIYIFALIFVTQIAVTSASDILFKQLSFNKNNTIEYEDYYGFNLYFDISSMKYQQQGELTFFSDLREYKGFISIHSKVIHSKDHIEKYFPIESKDSMFFAEKDIYQTGEGFFSLFYLYFNKTIDATNDVYLLIELLYDQNLLKKINKCDKKIKISKIAFIEDDITIPIKSDKYYYGNLFYLESVYYMFNLTNDDPNVHLILYCDKNIMSIKYNSLTDPTEPSYSGQVFHANQYNSSTQKKNSRVIIRLLSMWDYNDFVFHLYYDNDPLYLLPRCFLYEIYPIEINKENQTVFLLQQFWNETYCKYDKIYYYIENIYGNGVVQYDSGFTMDYILNKDQTLEKVFSTTSLATSSSVIQTPEYKRSNFFKIQCSSPCRFNLIFINRHDHRQNILKPRHLLYFQNYYGFDYKIQSLDDFVIDIESIERNDLNKQVSFILDNDKYCLSQNESNTNYNYRLRKLFKGVYQENNNLNFEYPKYHNNINWIRVIIHSNYNYTLVPLGISEYTKGIIIFKFKDDPAIDSYVIELALDHNPQYNETFYNNYYDYGNETYMPFPLYSSQLSITKYHKLTFANPYRKPNQKHKLIHHDKSTSYYYYALESVNNNNSISDTLSINYYHVYRDIHPYISPNTLIIIKHDHQHNTNTVNSIKRTLYSNDLPDTMLILQLYQCAYTGDLHYILSYDNQTLHDAYMSRRTQLLRNSYAVEYNIEINKYNNTHDTHIGLMLSYSYADAKLVKSVLTNELNTNYTIGYVIHGSSLSIYWNQYIKHTTDLVYKVYINRLNSQVDQCSILMDYEPHSVINNSDDNNNDNLVTYTINELTKGVYRVNVMAQINNTLYLTQIYDEAIIEITTNTNTIRTIMIIMLIMLGMYSCYLFYVINNICTINTFANI